MTNFTAYSRQERLTDPVGFNVFCVCSQCFPGLKHGLTTDLLGLESEANVKRFESAFFLMDSRGQKVVSEGVRFKSS